MNKKGTDFHSIEPYSDQQVSEEIKSLILDKKFHSFLGAELFPKVNKIFPFLVSLLFKYEFSRQFSSITSIKEFQNSLVPFVEKMINKTSDGFTYSGLENLSHKPTIFIGNHRDIALDPLFLNYLLYLEGYKTARIAIGDNLLDGRFFEKLMKLNKSFVVHRNIKGTKETLKKLKNLSSYINHSISNDKESIWIAQKEGRANDGNDLTEEAVLKMLYLSSKKTMDLKKWISFVNLTPVSISYEYDPLDVTKAIGWEGWEKLPFKENNKRDLSELLQGIKGKKGRIHLHICKNISDLSYLGDVTDQINKEIILNYKLWPSNYLSAKKLGLIDEKELDLDSYTEPILFKKLGSLNKDLRDKVLRIYATPCLNKKKWVGN